MPWPTTISVEPPPTSITAVGSLAGCAEVTPRKVARASSSPDNTRAAMPRSRAREAMKASPLLLSRTALVALAKMTSAFRLRARWT